MADEQSRPTRTGSDEQQMKAALRAAIDQFELRVSEVQHASGLAPSDVVDYILSIVEFPKDRPNTFFDMVLQDALEHGVARGRAAKRSAARTEATVAADEHVGRLRDRLTPSGESSNDADVEKAARAAIEELRNQRNALAHGM